MFGVEVVILKSAALALVFTPFGMRAADCPLPGAGAGGPAGGLSNGCVGAVIVVVTHGWRHVIVAAVIVIVVGVRVNHSLSVTQLVIRSAGWPVHTAFAPLAVAELYWIVHALSDTVQSPAL